MTVASENGVEQHALEVQGGTKPRHGRGGAGRPGLERDIHVLQEPAPRHDRRGRDGERADGEDRRRPAITYAAAEAAPATPMTMK